MIKIADVITMSHLLNEELPENSLKYLTKFYLKREVMKYEDAIKYGTNSKEFYDYATADAINTYDLFRLFSPQLEEEGLHHLAYDIEFPFSYVLAELAINGIKADRERAKEMYYEVRHLYYQLEDEMLKLFDKKYEVGITPRGRKVFAKPQINMNSGQQVVKCLQELGIKLTEKTKKGQMSTTTNALKKLKNDRELLEKQLKFVNLLLEYRQVSKLLSTFLAPFESFVEPDGRIRPSFHNTVCVTGRLCVDPFTLIECPRDLSKYPNGVPLFLLRTGDLVYSFDENKELHLKPIKWIGPTRIKPVIKIDTDKGPPLKVSYDHLVRKFRGEWVYAKDLKVGDRLLCMPKRGFKEDGYSYFFPNSKNRGVGRKGGGRYLEHRWIYKYVNGNLGTTAIIHHKDGNKQNNNINNLEWVESISAHKLKHSYKGNPGLLEKAVETGIGKSGRKLSKSTLRYYKNILRQNHKIINIDYEKDKLLWDLEVADTHCFIGNDIALHNSCSKPNVEQLPRENSIANIRDLFIAGDDNVFIVADYSGQELRILGEESQDRNLKKAFEQGLDIHLETANDFNELGLSKLQLTDHTPEHKEAKVLYKTERDSCKSVGFGIAYGKTKYGFAKSFNSTEEYAQQFIDKWLNRYPGVKTRIERCKQQIYQHGYVGNISGRRRRFPNFHKMNKWGKERCYRMGFNFLIQSYGADVVKVAAYKIIQNTLLKIVNIVHDEVVIECPKYYVTKAIEYIRQCMITSLPMSIIWECDINYAERYGKAK